LSLSHWALFHQEQHTEIPAPGQANITGDADISAYPSATPAKMAGVGRIYEL